MEASDWIGVASGIVGFLALIVTWLAIRYNRRDRQEDTAQVRSQHMDRRIKDLAQEEIRPSLETFRAQLTTLSHTAAPEMIRALVREELEPLKLDIRGIQTTLQLYLAGQSMDAAKVLHQPDPLRQPVDDLLEAYMEGTLTAEERIQLKKYLVTIRNYVPGVSPYPGFPIRDGEQYVAASLLRTMDLVNPEIIAAMGHAAHRADGGKR